MISKPLFKNSKQACCLTCTTRCHSEFQDLKDEDLSLLHSMKVSNEYQPGQILFYQGNPCLGLHCLQSGTVALRKRDPAGTPVLVGLSHAGSALGYSALFSGAGYSATAEALTPCRVCFLDRAGLGQLMGRDPRLARRFLNRLARDVEAAEEAHLRAASMSVRARLASLLLDLKDRFATVDDEGNLTIQLPLTRKDMASIVGTRPETIARTIRALDQDGVTSFKGTRVMVPDLDALFDEVEILESA